MEKVEILLASYNGEKYIEEMIESILAQDYQDWHLTVSDDQSTDGTAKILDAFAQHYPEKITHYRSGKRFGNAQNHFMHLLEKFHEAPYIMFCDQDDVWHPDKISKTLKKMKQTEKRGKPAMVHTDLRVVDGVLNQISPSFMRFSNLRGDRLALNQLLVQNVVTGCTMMINQALAELACSHMPKAGILMHDWWLALIASAMGTTGYLDEACIDYRQHGSNVVGAKNTRSIKYIANRLCGSKIRTALEQTFSQARVFDNCFGAILDDKTRRIVQLYAALSENNSITRRISYVKYGLLKYGVQRKIAQLIWG